MRVSFLGLYSFLLFLKVFTPVLFLLLWRLFLLFFFELFLDMGKRLPILMHSLQILLIVAAVNQKTQHFLLELCVYRVNVLHLLFQERVTGPFAYLFVNVADHVCYFTLKQFLRFELFSLYSQDSLIALLFFFKYVRVEPSNERKQLLLGVLDLFAIDVSDVLQLID